MNYLNDFEIYEGSNVRIERDGTLEGYAKLILPDGIPMTFIADGKLMIRQRWLVEWLSLIDLTNIVLTMDERFTQSNMAGLRTHRNLEFYADGEWLSYKDPTLEEDALNPIKPNDDFKYNDIQMF